MHMYVKWIEVNAKLYRCVLVCTWITLYSLSPSCISLLSRTIKMSGLEVAMAHVAGPTNTNTHAHIYKK